MGSSSKSYTPPKGKPTRARGERSRASYRIPAIFEWIIVGVVLAALMVTAWYFSLGDSGGTPHNGALLVPSAVATAGVLDDVTSG